MGEPVGPVVNTLNAPFWEAAADGRLVLPHCRTTGQAFWPPSPASPFITGGAVVWREVEPTGTLRAVAVYRRSFQKAFAGLMPYSVGLIELDAGPRLQIHIRASDDPGVPKSGDRVRIVFARIVDGGPFVPTLGTRIAEKAGR